MLLTQASHSNADPEPLPPHLAGPGVKNNIRAARAAAI